MPTVMVDFIKNGVELVGGSLGLAAICGGVWVAMNKLRLIPPPHRPSDGKIDTSHASHPVPGH